MKLLSVLTLISAAGAGGIVASQHLNQITSSSDIAVYGPAADPTELDPQDMLESLSVDTPDIELTRTPFFDGDYAIDRWRELHAQAQGAGERQARPSAARRTAPRQTARSDRRTQRNTRGRFDTRTNRRRSIFEMSRSYSRNGSALERQRRGRHGTSFRFSKPYRSGAAYRYRWGR